MGACVSGVSNGTAVGPTPLAQTAPQVSGGIALSQPGDYATIFVANAANPDIAGAFYLSGSAVVGASLAVQSCATLAAWTAGQWTTLSTVNPAGATQIPITSLTGVFAVRVLLNSGGPVRVSGNTTPAAPTR